MNLRPRWWPKIDYDEVNRDPRRHPAPRPHSRAPRRPPAGAPPRSSGQRTRLSVPLIIVLIIGILFAWSWTDPHVDIPVVSRLACSLKGGVWYNSSWLQPAGCYANPATTTPPPTVP